MGAAIASQEFGLKFFPASSPALEKVFMELVLPSAAADPPALAAQGGV
jgi:hypothetical protein